MVEITIQTAPVHEITVERPPIHEITIQKVGTQGPAGTSGINGTNGLNGTNGTNGTNGVDGDDGREVQLQVTGTHVQWRYVGSVSWTNLIALTTLTGPQGPAGADGVDGTNGSDGADGNDGAPGAPGIDGIDGTNGTDGIDGTNGTDGIDGWSPVLAIATDGARRVAQVVDWVGGAGAKPATGSYVGAAGFEALIANGVDIRGASGSGTGDFVKATDDTDDITEGTTNKFTTAGEKAKLAHITVTQAVDLDAIETNSVASKVKTDFLTVTQAVDLDTIETNSNASKTKTDHLTVTQAVDLDAMETKLAGIASAATANDTDANLRDRTTHTGSQAQSTVTNLVTDLAAKAPLASPALTGTPTAPTASLGTNTTQIATMAAVQAAVAALLNASPGTLDTLDEIAAALGDDPNFATTITGLIAAKLAITNNLSDLNSATTALTNLGLSANGKSLVTAANYAAMRALLDLEPGTDFYSMSAAAAAFAAISHTHTVSQLSDATANGRSLIAAANYAAMRALLDLEAGTDFYSVSAANAAFQAANAKLTALAASSGVTGTITVSTSNPSGGSDGDIWLKYTP